MKKDYLDTMNEYTESEKQPEKNLKKFTPQKPGRKQNMHEHYFTGDSPDEDPNEKNSVLPGKGEKEDRKDWNDIQKKKDKGMKVPSPPVSDFPQPEQK